MIINGHRLIRKSDSTEIVRWAVVPDSIVLPNKTLFNIPVNLDITDYYIEPYQWTIQDPIPITAEQVIDGVFPDSGFEKALFEALFEIANRLQVLESKPPITKNQLRTWLINKAS